MLHEFIRNVIICIIISFLLPSLTLTLKSQLCVWCLSLKIIPPCFEPPPVTVQILFQSRWAMYYRKVSDRQYLIEICPSPNLFFVTFSNYLLQNRQFFFFVFAIYIILNFNLVSYVLIQLICIYYWNLHVNQEWKITLTPWGKFSKFCHLRGYQ